MRTKIPRIVPSMPNWTLALIAVAACAALTMARYWDEASQATIFAG